MTQLPSERREVFFSGRVQGVGFRQRTFAIAQRFAVTGIVENLADGRVRILVEGSAAEIERFLAAVALELDRYIAGSLANREMATGEFAGFMIRR